MQIAMRELTSGLSGYVARACAGEVIVITSHGKPVARLVGVPADGSAGVARLLARGAATWGGSKPAVHPTVALCPGGKDVSAIVLEDRG